MSTNPDVVARPSALDQLLFDLFVTAMEGGISYWATSNSYHWAESSVLKHYADGSLVHEDTKGFYADILDEGNDPAPKQYRIDRSVMAKGYRLATTTWPNKLNWSTERPPLVVGPDTDWDFDASDADMILQLGLFEKVVYG
jgi:hypothetical protein